jgi:hypothetical protein
MEKGHPLSVIGVLPRIGSILSLESGILSLESGIHTPALAASSL